MAEINPGSKIELAPLPKVPETAEGNEQALSPEQDFEIPKRGSEALAPPAFKPVAGKFEPAPPPLTPLAQEIETVLEEDMTAVFSELNPVQQAEFKRQGEITARKIYALLQQVKVKVGEILRLISSWLKTVPGLNKYFVEQAAKIKADKIFKLQQPKK
ncbi:MAG: hypothetical protein WC621_05190 [Patescibacteria group bacterium]